MTTLCESWLCAAHDSAGSANHPSFGSFDTYLHSALGGLRTISNASVSGWKHFIVQPDWAAMLKLKRGSLSHETRFGVAALSWTWESSTVTFVVTVPVGSTAEARHPVRLGENCTLASGSFPGHEQRSDSGGNEFFAQELGSGMHSLRVLYHCHPQSRRPQKTDDAPRSGPAFTFEIATGAAVASVDTRFLSVYAFRHTIICFLCPLEALRCLLISVFCAITTAPALPHPPPQDDGRPHI
jgi:hypothetical protein